MNAYAVILGVLFVVIWSSAFTSGKFIVADAPPITALALRFFVSGLIGVAIGWLGGARLAIARQDIAPIVIFGLCQNALYLGLNFMAFQRIDASIAVVIASLLPICVGIASWVFLRERLSPLGIAGLGIGLIGAGVVLAARLGSGADSLGILYCILGLIALTVATLTVRRLTASGDLMLMVGLQMLVGAAALAPFALVFETWDVNWTLSLAISFSYTLVFPGLIATWIWFRLLGEIGATKAATFHFLNPFFGVVIAALILGEEIARADIIGVLFIMVAILAVQLSKMRPG